MLNNSLLDSDSMRSIVYAVLVFFVGWISLISYRYQPYFYYGYTALFLFLIIINLLGSPYNPLYPRLIKYLGYISCFTLGYIFYRKKWSLKCNKVLLYTTLLLPLFLVSFLDHTPHKTVFFPMSNTYSYFGLACALFYYVIKKEEKKAFWESLFILAIYIVSCSTLGIVFAIVVAVLFINRRNLRLIIASSIIMSFGVLFVMFSDFAVFARIRDVFTIMNAMTWHDWTHLQEMDFYSFSQGIRTESNRVDNTSFLWRLAHWMKIMDDFGEHWITALPFGLGDNYSTTKTGYACHNEYLKAFAENGLIVFSILIYWIFSVHKILRKQRAYYFVLAVLIYHFTENLIDSFVANALIYFSIGYLCCKYGYKRHLVNIGNLLVSHKIQLLRILSKFK